MVGFFPGIVFSSLNDHNHVVQDLLQQSQAFLERHFQTIYISHIKSHSGPFGVMDQGNETVDHPMVSVFTSPREDHQALHTKTCCLHVNDHIL